MLQKLRLLVVLILLCTFAACDFEHSPWHTDAHCPGLSVEENLTKLNLLPQTSHDVPFKVAILGDPQQYPGDLELVVKHLNARQDIDFILLLGDLAETGVKQEFEWSCKALQNSNYPILTVIGNHDALSFGAEIWQTIFGEFNYSFQFKNTKFVAYNDNQYEFPDVPDRDFLTQQAIDKQTDQHLIAMSHIEPWGRDPQLSPWLASLGYDLALHAHNHRFDYYQNTDGGMKHFITADTKDRQFAIMTVTDDDISLAYCSPDCVPATASSR